MRPARLAFVAAVSALALCTPPPETRAGAAERGATLAFRQDGGWRTFWRSDRPPERWTAADPALARALVWRRLVAGLEWTSVRLACGAPTGRARLIVARLDPRRIRLTLQMDLSRDGRPGWSLERTPEDALLSVNAGQFTGAMPWGWVVIDGRQRLRPGAGPLVSTVMIDAAGAVRWAHGDSPHDPAGLATGFQSFPTLLAGDGAVPLALRAPGRGVNRTHRDTRLAMGEDRDGRILIALTRFDGMNGVAGSVPLGPTTPEMAAIMGALGAADAVMLDGGISAQLRLRDPARPAPMEWRGWRRVPLALIARPRGSGTQARSR